MKHITRLAEKGSQEGGRLSIDLCITSRLFDRIVAAQLATTDKDEDDILDEYCDSFAALFHPECRASVRIDAPSDPDGNHWLYVELELFADVHSGITALRGVLPDMRFDLNGLNLESYRETVISGPDPLEYGLTRSETVSSMTTDSLDFISFE